MFPPPPENLLVHPEPLVCDSPSVLSETQLKQWREKGYVLVDNFFNSDEVEMVRSIVDHQFPNPQSPEAEFVTDYGAGGKLEFPTGFDDLDKLTLDPRLLKAAVALLGLKSEADLRMSQSHIWAKYGRKKKLGGSGDNQDQRIHMDYPNHFLTHPPEWYMPETVAMIAYFDDHFDCCGQTALVSREGDEDPAYSWPYVKMPGVANLPWSNDRAMTEKKLGDIDPAIAQFRSELYERERYAAFRPGTVLFYRHDLWHRGTPMRPGSRRIVWNLSFRKAEADWVSLIQTGWAWSMLWEEPKFERLLCALLPEQRAVLGFPAPGSSYWNEARITAVTARYGPYGFDPTPYVKALKIRRKEGSSV